MLTEDMQHEQMIRPCHVIISCVKNGHVEASEKVREEKIELAPGETKSNQQSAS